MICLAIAVNLTPVFLTTLSAEFGHEAAASSQPEAGPQAGSADARKLTNEQLGRIGAAIFVGLVVGILATGPLADRLGAKPFAIAGNVFVGAGLAVLGLAPSYAAVLAAAFIMGLGAGVLDMVLSPIISALQPERRAAAMNWLHSFYCVGAVGTILAGSLALRLGWGWRSISLCLIALPALVGVGFAALRVPPLVAEGQERMRLRLLIRRPYFLAALAAIFFVGGTELAMAQWLAAYAEKGLGYSTWVSGMALLAFSIAMAVGRMTAGTVGHRVATAHLMLVSCGAAVLFYVVACLAPWPAIALGACVGVGLACSCLWPSMLALAADRFPQGGASMFAMLSAFGNSGGIVLPWVVGMVADLVRLRKIMAFPATVDTERLGLHLGLGTATLCPILLAAILLWMRRQPVEDRSRQ